MFFLWRHPKNFFRWAEISGKWIRAVRFSIIDNYEKVSADPVWSIILTATNVVRAMAVILPEVLQITSYLKKNIQVKDKYALWGTEFLAL